MFEFIHQTIDNKYYYILKMIVSSLDDTAFVLGEPAFVNNDISFTTNTNIISFFSKPNIPITRRIIPKEVSSLSKIISFLIIGIIFSFCVFGTVILFISLYKLNQIFIYDFNIQTLL